MPAEMQILSFPYMAALHVWVFELCVGIVGLFALHAVFKRLVKLVQARALERPGDWIQHLQEIVFGPMRAVFLIIGGYYGLSILGCRFGFQSIMEALEPFRNASVVICLAWMSLRWKKAVLQASQRHWKVSTPGLQHALDKFLSILIWVLAMLIVLRVFHLDIMPLLTFGGIGAAAVGFAAKDVIGNFFGGLMLSVSRPFSEGDYIVISEQRIEGYVERMGWYLTAIRDKDKRPIYLPNSIFASAVVVNNSRMTHRRIYETIGVSYADFSKLSELTGKIRAYAVQNRSIDSSEPLLVFFQNIGAYSLDILIDMYVYETHWEGYLQVREEVLKSIYAIILETGAEIPSPKTSVEIMQKI